MVIFDAVGTGGREQLEAALQACKGHGVTVLEQRQVPSHGIFKCRGQANTHQAAQAAIEAAGFILAQFD